jgi:hypothetical protein
MDNNKSEKNKFESSPPLGMTDADNTAFCRCITKANNEQLAAMLAMLKTEIARREQPEYRAALGGV